MFMGVLYTAIIVSVWFHTGAWCGIYIHIGVGLCSCLSLTKGNCEAQYAG